MAIMDTTHEVEQGDLSPSVDRTCKSQLVGGAFSRITIDVATIYVGRPDRWPLNTRVFVAGPHSFCSLALSFTYACRDCSAAHDLEW